MQKGFEEKSAKGGKARGRGRSFNAPEDTRTLWEKVGKIGMHTNQLILKKACSENASIRYPMMETVFTKLCYVIEDRPTLAKTMQELEAAKKLNCSELMGFENVLFRSQLGKTDDEKLKETPSPEGYSVKLVNRIHTTRVTNWMNSVDKMRVEKREAFRELWSKCDELVKSACRADGNFTKIEATEDVLKLFILLQMILAGGGNMDPRDRKFKIERDWFMLQKNPKESLTSFKEKFDLEVSKMEMVGVEFSQEALADSFMNKLDHAFENLVKIQKRTGKYPGAQIFGDRYTTLEEAFAGAQSEAQIIRGMEQRQRDQEVRGNRFGVSFAGRGRASDKGRNRKKEKEEESSKEKADIKESEVEDSSTICYRCKGRGHKKEVCPSEEGSEVNCYKCRGVGHYASDCPSQKKM